MPHEGHDQPDPHDHVACTRAWRTLRRAHDRVARRLTTDLSRECDLAINDVDVLLHLRTHAGETVRLTDLREAVPRSQPALSRLVARLAARGLVTRSDAADDGRAAVVALMKAGGALLDRAAEVHALAAHEAFTGRFTGEERAALLRTLSRIDG